jgi:hypothetical protein
VSLLADRSASTIIPTSHFDHSGRTPSAIATSQIRRTKQLGALAAALPIASADRYTEALTDADVATLKHVTDPGMGARMLRALASDLAYLKAWRRTATERPLPWLAEPELFLKFAAHHLWSPDKKALYPAHGKSEDVMEELR